MPQRSGVQHWVDSILGFELSQDQDTCCTAVSWKQNLIWCHLLQQGLLGTLIIITFQQLYSQARSPFLRGGMHPP